MIEGLGCSGDGLHALGFNSLLLKCNVTSGGTGEGGRGFVTTTTAAAVELRHDNICTVLSDIVDVHVCMHALLCSFQLSSPFKHDVRRNATTLSFNLP